MMRLEQTFKAGMGQGPADCRPRWRDALLAPGAKACTETFIAVGAAAFPTSGVRLLTSRGCLPFNVQSQTIFFHGFLLPVRPFSHLEGRPSPPEAAFGAAGGQALWLHKASQSSFFHCCIACGLAPPQRCPRGAKIINCWTSSGFQRQKCAPACAVRLRAPLSCSSIIER